MQRWDSTNRVQPAAASRRDAGDEDGFDSDSDADEGSAGETGAPESIRDIQRRRRDETRLRAEIEAILASPEEGDEEDEPAHTGPPAPPPARVFVVFRGARWNDPDGALRESDSIAGVYATEDAARRAAAELTRGQTEREDAWYQPYAVES